MKETLRPGASGIRRLIVDRERTIGFMGEEGWLKAKAAKRVAARAG